MSAAGCRKLFLQNTLRIRIDSPPVGAGRCDGPISRPNLDRNSFHISTLELCNSYSIRKVHNFTSPIPSPQSPAPSPSSLVSIRLFSIPDPLAQFQAHFRRQTALGRAETAVHKSCHLTADYAPARLRQGGPGQLGVWRSHKEVSSRCNARPRGRFPKTSREEARPRPKTPETRPEETPMKYLSILSPELRNLYCPRNFPELPEFPHAAELQR